MNATFNEKTNESVLQTLTEADYFRHERKYELSRAFGAELSARLRRVMVYDNNCDENGKALSEVHAP